MRRKTVSSRLLLQIDFSHGTQARAAEANIVAAQSRRNIKPEKRAFAA
ncbi:MAG: hypothetical protein N2444_07900 [Methylocystis sp.]|nr:hypothetical protein [Methylocystis sp.]